MAAVSNIPSTRNPGSRMSRHLGLPAASRMFGGKRYDRQSFHATKRSADTRAAMWRKQGNAARVVNFKPVQLQEQGKLSVVSYAVYVN